MADLTITAANVEKTSGNDATATAGATITAGDIIYLDTADSNKAKLADVTTSSLTATVEGVALNGASANQPVTYLKANGVLDIGATLTVSETYVLSASGAVSPIGDLTSNDYVSYIGYATAADSLTLTLTSTGVQVP